jgi:hypothetical protein
LCFEPHQRITTQTIHPIHTHQSIKKVQPEKESHFSFLFPVSQVYLQADVASIYIQLKQTAPFDPIKARNSPRWDLPELGSMDAGEENRSGNPKGKIGPTIARGGRRLGFNDLMVKSRRLCRGCSC